MKGSFNKHRWEDSKSQRCQLSTKWFVNWVQLKEESHMDFILELHQ